MIFRVVPLFLLEYVLSISGYILWSVKVKSSQVSQLVPRLNNAHSLLYIANLLLRACTKGHNPAIGCFLLQRLCDLYLPSM